jgi:hypothetical protein
MHYLEATKTFRQLRQVVIGTLSFMEYRFKIRPGSRIFPTRLNSSPLEGKFGFARGMQGSTGKLQVSTLF